MAEFVLMKVGKVTGSTFLPLLQFEGEKECGELETVT